MSTRADILSARIVLHSTVGADLVSALPQNYNA